MATSRNILFLLLLLFGLAFSVQGNSGLQNEPTRAARRHFENALKAREILDYQAAIQQLERAIARSPNYYDAHLLKATIFSETRQFEQSIVHYERAIEINPSGRPETHFNLAEAYHKTGQYLLAKKQYQRFLELEAGGPTLRKQAEWGVEWCRFAIEAIQNPVPFEPLNLGEKINTEFSEYSPALTADEQTLVFTRKVPTIGHRGHPTRRYQEDFFVSNLVDGHWSQASPLGPPINTPGNEGAQTLLPDGRFMFLTACNRSDGMGSCDIYFSRRVGNSWSLPVNMGTPVNSSAWDSHPSISADGKILYFSSARDGSIGPKDIWMSTLDESGQFWSEPTNLGSVINTTGKEMSPFIHHDNQTLYFASDGHPGMGGLDLFVSRRDSLGYWSTPQNLGYPINTHADEFGLIVGASGVNAYFASDMAGAFGGQDFYHFQLPIEARPNPVTYMKGIVFDAKTNERLQATFLLIDIESGNEMIRSSSDRQTGEFLVAIPTDRELALNVSKDGYLFFSENFNYIETRTSAEPYIRDIPLTPIEQGQVTVLRNVFFDTDSYELKPESEAELVKLVEFLIQNPSITIEIGGHTDNVGSFEYNKELSERRAAVVVSFLTNNGIEPNRLSAKGYSFDKPIASNETDEGRAKNRRTEFKITSQ